MRTVAVVTFVVLATYAISTHGQQMATTTSTSVGPITPLGGLGGSAVCPSVIFSQSLARDPTGTTPGASSNSAVPHVFSWSVSGSVPGTTLTGVQFVDCHFGVNSEPMWNVKMNPINQNTWSLGGLQLQSGDKVNYWFTYQSIINGVPINCDTSQFTFTAGTGGGSTVNPSSTATPATPQALNTAPIMMQPVSMQPLFAPQFPSQFQITTPQALQGGPQPPPFPQPSGVTSAVCPAVIWSWQLLPAAGSNGANTMALVFVAQGPANPATALNSVASVDAHYVLNGTPTNVRMQPAGAPNTFATNLVIPNPNASTLQFYFTVAANLNTGPITCDTAQQSVSASSGAFGPQSTGGSITPSSTTPMGGSGTNAPPSQALRGLQPPMIIPVTFQPFATPTGAGTTGGNMPSSPPQNPTEASAFMDSQRQKMQSDFAANSQNAFSGAQPLQQPIAPIGVMNPFSGGVSIGPCPAIDFNQQVTQQPDQSWAVMWFAGSPRTMGAVLQSVDAVNITLDGAATPVPMSRVNGLVWSAPVKKTLKAGDTLRFTFTYSALISGTSANCTTPQFVFSISPAGTAAPAGQTAGATTPLQLAQLIQQIPVTIQPFGANSQQNVAMQPFALNAANDPSQNVAINAAPSNSLPPLPPSGNNNNGLGTQSNVCPAVAFTSAVGASQGGGTTLSFTATKALKGTLQNINFVDLHLSIPGRPDVNGRMMQSNSQPLMWTFELPWIPGGQLPAGSTYYFTICTILSTAGSANTRVDCDSPVTTIASGTGSVAPTSTGTGGGSPSLLPMQPQPLIPSGLPSNTQFVIPVSSFPQQPSGALSTGSTPSAIASNAPCPAISWTYSVVPNNSGQYKLVWTPGRALRPDATLSAVNSVDAHYSVSAAPAVSANLKAVSSASAGSPDSFELSAPIALKSGDVLAFYFSYSPVIASTALQCDTSVLTFVAPQTGAAPNFPPATGGANGLPPAPTSPLSTALPSLGTGTGSGGPNTAALTTPPSVGSVVPSSVMSGIASLISAANGGGGAGVPQSVVCPAILFDKQILPLGNGNYQLNFIGNSPTNPTTNLQALNSVDAHYVIANSQQVNARMTKSSTNPLLHSLNVPIPPGSIFAVYFTYSAQLSSSSNPTSCDTSVFSFSS